MRVERLVIEAGENTLALDLHPRLTVVAGMGAVERDCLIGELIGSLAGRRRGVHVELEERSGRHLAVFRPTRGRHRAVDVDRAQDVSREFRGEDGHLDLLRPLGLDSTSARRLARFGAADLGAETNRSASIEALAGLDQGRLWSAATALRQADEKLTFDAEAVDSGPEDAGIVARVEAHHLAVERSTARLERLRRTTFYVSGVGGLLTLPAVAGIGRAGLFVAVVALAAAVASIVEWQRTVRAHRAEEAALAEAGAESYLGFHLQRVNTLLADDDQRQRLMGSAGSRQQAWTDWRRLAGDIPVDWALAHREEIEAAARLRRQIDALGTLSTTAPELSADDSGDLAHALVARLASARDAGGEGLPLLLDEPFITVDPSVKPLLLELLGRASTEQQVVLLTEDDDVASWARLEQLTGEVALVEPVPAATG